MSTNQAVVTSETISSESGSVSSPRKNTNANLSKIKMTREATIRFDTADKACDDFITVNKKLSVKLEEINERKVPSNITIAELEGMKSSIEEKKIGLGKFDKEIVGFLIDDDDESILTSAKRKAAFELPDSKKNKENPNEIYFRKKNDCMIGGDADIFRTQIFDDTDIDITKVLFNL